jgi:hypothetical protein
MAEQKVNESDLEQLQQLQTRFETLITVYGELHLKKRVVESDIQRTEEAFNEVETARQEIGNRIQAQFGSEGTVNLTTGEFVPA